MTSYLSRTIKGGDLPEPANKSTTKSYTCLGNIKTYKTNKAILAKNKKREKPKERRNRVTE